MKSYRPTSADPVPWESRLITTGLEDVIQADGPVLGHK